MILWPVSAYGRRDGRSRPTEVRRLLFIAVTAGLALGAALNLLGWQEQSPTPSQAAVTVFTSRLQHLG